MSWRGRQYEEQDGRTDTQIKSTQMEQLAPHASFDSEPSRISGFHSTSNMSEDMHQILSPSFDSVCEFPGNHDCLAESRSSEHSANLSSYSADSIIRRVEEEIAAARMAAVNAKCRMNDANTSNSPPPRNLATTASTTYAKISRLDVNRVKRDSSPSTIRRKGEASISLGHQQLPSSALHTPKRTNVQPALKQDPPPMNESPLDRSSTYIYHLQSKDQVGATAGTERLNKMDEQVYYQDTEGGCNSEDAFSIDDDMHDILGVNDEDDEKKSSTEPIPSASSDKRSYALFDKIDYLRRQVGSNDSGDYVEADNEVRINKETGSSSKSLNHRSMVINSYDRVYANGTNAGAGVGRETVYFTDEEWQVDSNVLHEMEGSTSRSPTSESPPKTMLRKWENGDTAAKLNDLNDERNLGAIDEFRSTAHSPLQRNLENSDELGERGESDDPTPKAKGSKVVHSDDSTLVADPSDIVAASSYNSQVDCPILHKSSSEGAIVNVQHHPVFQKRISSVDSNVNGSEVNRSSIRPMRENFNKSGVKTEHDKNKESDKNMESRNEENPLDKKKEPASIAVSINNNPENDFYHHLQSNIKEATILEALQSNDTSQQDVASLQDFQREDIFVTQHRNNAVLLNGELSKDMLNLEKNEVVPLANKVHISVTGNADDNDARSDSSATCTFSEVHIVSEITTKSCDIEDKNDFELNEAEKLQGKIDPVARPFSISEANPTNGVSGISPVATFRSQLQIEDVFSGGNGDNCPISASSSLVGAMRAEDPVATSSLSFSNKDDNIEWHKASELLYKLKEQKESFSANFACPHTPGKDIILSAGKIGDETPTSDSRKMPLTNRHLTIEDNYESMDCASDDYQSTVLNQALRSPRYFNFMRVKRAKQRANHGMVSSGADLDVASMHVEESGCNYISLPHEIANEGNDKGNYENDKWIQNEMQRARDPTKDLISSNHEQEGEHAGNQSEIEKSEQNTSPQHLSFSSNSQKQVEHRTSNFRSTSMQADPPGNGYDPNDCYSPERDVFASSIDDVNFRPQTNSSVQDEDSLGPLTSQTVQMQISSPRSEFGTCTFKQAPLSKGEAKGSSSRAQNLQLQTAITKGKSNEEYMKQSQRRQNTQLPNTCLQAKSLGVKQEETSKVEVGEELSKHSSRHIRFRNPFPIIKPPSVPVDMNTIISKHTTEIPEIPVRWMKPKKELKQLIVAAMGTSLARRSNACGALKLLTRQKKNQMTLVRTDGFLTAVTFAASQKILEEEGDLALDARTRAVATLRNICIPKDNRLLVFKHPGVVESLSHVAEVDSGEGRALAVGALALLAKTQVCREGLAQVEGLIDILSHVMSGEAHLSSDTQFLSKVGAAGDEVETCGSNAVPVDQNEMSNAYPSALSHERRTQSAVLSRSIDPVDSIRNQAEERREEYRSEARASACAALLHLSKQCSISHHLCTNVTLLNCLVHVANEVMTPLHTKSLEIICNLTRFPTNNYILSRYDGVIDTLVGASNAAIQENRLHSLRSLQNISADPASKSILATTQVLTRMISSAMRKDPTGKELAVATIYNITTEPSAVAAITNTKNVVATMVHLAHSPDSSSEVRILACEALATISLWLQTLAATGKVPQGVLNVPLPSQKTSGWLRWD